jgi:dipeptidyl-peptidase-4
MVRSTFTDLALLKEESMNRIAGLLAAVAGLCAATGASATSKNVVPQKILTVERIYAEPSLTGSAPASIRWLPDSKGISYLVERDDDRDFVVASVPSGKEKTMFTVGNLEVPEDLRKKDDERFRIGSYRWTEGGLVFFVYAGEVFTLAPETQELVRRTESDIKEANVTASPDGSTLAFTRDHDLYALRLDDNEVVQLTDTGSDSIYNGVLDWVYMEELFTRGDVQGYWWSPDSRKIAYLQIDESPVQTFPLVDFVPQYNTHKLQHYPKAGAPIPIVRVAVYDFDNGRTTWIDIDTTDESYIARLNWLGDSERIAIEKINRDQDHLTLYFANIATGTTTPFLEEKKDTWVNVTYMKHYYESKKRFVWNSDRDGFSHLYLYNTDGDGEALNAITNGDWEVSALNGVDEKKGDVFFTGLEKSVIERHIYRVPAKGGRLTRLSKLDGTHRATFSPDMRHYIDRFSSIDMPRRISVHTASSGKELFIIDECDVSELAEYNLPRKEFFTITSKEGVEFYCSMIKPSDFDPDKKYPVIVYTYGGPHAQRVNNMWAGTRMLWHAMMAQRGYIVFTLDNRGSYGRGPAWENPILKNMGEYELADQLTGVEYLKSMPYVDENRIGIWGWSYGGYMTAMAMFKAPGAFKVGVCVAPVSDWRFYDSIYTERYMKHPDDNKEGYDNSAPIHFVDGLRGKFLLMHGTADDNVHVANSIRLAHELIKAGKDFDFMLYPQKYHGISGRDARVHLYRKITKYFDDNL